MKRFVYILSLFTLIALLISRCERERVEPVPATMEQELSLIPFEPGGTGYMNFASFRDSPFFDSFIESGKKCVFEYPDYREFVQETGFDPVKDIDEIYFALPGTLPGEHKFSGLAVIRGTFNPKKIMAFAAKKDEHKEMETLTYKDHHLFRPEMKEVVFCFADDSHLIAGNDSLVKAWLDNFDSPEKKNALSKQFRSRLQLLQYKTGAWFTLNTAPFLEKFEAKYPNHPQLKKFEGLKSIQDVNFSAKFGDDLFFNGTGVFSDREKAGLFLDALKGLIATGKLSLSSDRQAVDVLNKISVKQKGNRVLVNFKFNRDDLEKLKANKAKLSLK
ncbi:MAG TPA: hypothetical protein ENK14_03895 [Caldithrix sp.]|nr:hypothetical protein [Caldithrix sp.]